jgi:hypothetical protein
VVVGVGVGIVGVVDGAVLVGVGGAVVVGAVEGRVVTPATAEPKNVEDPKSNTPPSEATKRYPVPVPFASIP